MICGVCGGAIGKRSGKGGGYYGCISAGKGACDNKLIVRRTLTERIVLTALSKKLGSAENLAYLLRRVEEKVKEMHGEVPETIRLKDVQLIAEQRRVDNFVSYIARGRSSEAIGRALEAAEGRAKELAADLIVLKASKEKTFKTPPIEWIAERVGSIQEVLDQRVEKSALILRRLLGKIRLEPVKPDIGKPYLKVTTSLQPLAIFEVKPGSDESEPGHSTEPDDGSNSLRWWTRSQRIGTFSEIPIEAAILDTEAPPVYQQIASKAVQLQQLGMNNSAIARRLGVNDKTVARAVAWLLEAQRPRSD